MRISDWSSERVLFRSHVPLLDAGIRWANALLERNEVLIRSMVHERSGSILRWTGLDETIANKIIDALDRLLGEMADDPGHPLRLKIEDSLAELARSEEHTSELQSLMRISYAVLCLKKKKQIVQTPTDTTTQYVHKHH